MDRLLLQPPRQYDVFVVPVQGGRPSRLTFDSADDHVTGWSPDGKHVLFTSTRNVDLPGRVELYTVPVDGGAVKQVSAFEGRDGDLFARRGTGSPTCAGPGSGIARAIAARPTTTSGSATPTGRTIASSPRINGQDNSPMWSADGKHLYYVSDALSGTANLDQDRPR